MNSLLLKSEDLTKKLSTISEKEMATEPKLILPIKHNINRIISNAKAPLFDF